MVDVVLVGEVVDVDVVEGLVWVVVAVLVVEEVDVVEDGLVVVVVAVVVVVFVWPAGLGLW